MSVFWLELLPSILLATLLLFGPGYLLTRACGVRRAVSLALAPAVSTTIVAVGAVVAGRLGVFWVPVPVALTAVLSAGAILIRVVLRVRRGGAVPPATPAGEPWGWWAASWVLAVLLQARHLFNVFDRADAFSQTFDNVFHLNAIRFIVETGNASSLTLGELNTPPGGPTFYPAAFHDLASAVMLGNGGNITHAVNGLLVVVVALVWPLSCLFLLRSVLRPRPVTILAAGVLTASFTGFPLLLLEFGVLYPNLMGLAFLPTLVGLVLALTSLGERVVTPVQAMLLGALALPGVALAHPNVVMTLFLMASPLAVYFGVGQVRQAIAGEVRRPTAAVRAAAALAFLVLVAAVWPLVRPAVSIGDWPPPLTTPSAFGHALLNSPPGYRAVWLPSFAMLIGMYAAIRRGRSWLVASWGAVTILWLVISSWEPSRLRLFLVGIWYQDSVRFFAAMPLLALPLAALGVEWVAERLEGFGGLRARPWRWTPLVVALAGALVFAGLTQNATYMNAAVDAASRLYAIQPDSPLVDTDEFAVIQRIPELVPKDAVIAVNPWNGSALAYAFTGRQVTAPHMFYGETPARKVVAAELDEAASDPTVCPVLRSAGVSYALDFGSREVHGGSHDYPGFDRLSSARGFQEVARSGHAVLYRITACG